MTDEHLEHHGIKGMKWGVRNTPKRSSRKTQTKTRYSKPAPKLTDAELRRRIKRLESEKRYNELNAKDKSKGRKFVSEVINAGGKQALTAAVAVSTTVAVKSVIDKQFGSGTSDRVYRRGR